ncbi:hypothetical protein M23134_00534 [Microscilla marina ATCC 23134]|uniref:Uncharacterized protein n=2 Tax=Microscilla marina TaxID=1027 RepID=A1ZJB4_MICM2|nr:hypothetical protein M23134_00534 [Microscilla marina ATCC 23134]
MYFISLFADWYIILLNNFLTCERQGLRIKYLVKRLQYGDAMLYFYNKQPKAKRETIDKQLQINKYANPEIGQGYTMASGGEKDSNRRYWIYHWAGVVMKSDDGADNVTLENYSVSRRNEQNKKWSFSMYGTQKEGQTFHEQHKESQQHGKTPTTLTIQKK